MKLKYQLTLLFLLIVLLVTSSISLLFYTNQREVLQGQLMNQLESVSETKRLRIKSLIKDRKELTDFPSSDLTIVNNVRNYFATGEVSFQKELAFALRRYVSAVSSIQAIHILDVNGDIVASSDSSKIGNNWAHFDFFRSSVQGQKEFGNIHFDENENYNIHITSPLYADEEIIGVLIISRLAQEIVSLTSDYTGLGETGETYFGQQYGDSIKYLNSLRYEKDAALQKTFPVSDTSVSMGAAINWKKDTIVRAKDYRRTEVLSSLRYIPETGWGMVTEIDYAEAVAPVVSLRNSLIFINGIAVFFAAVVAYISGSWFAYPIEKLTTVSHRFSEGDYSERADIMSGNEIGRLAYSFNLMAEKLQEKIMRSESLFSTVFDSVEHGIVFLKAVRGEDRKIVDFEYMLVNKCAEQFLGRERSDLIGKRLLREYPFIKEIGNFDLQVKAIKTGKTVENEYYYGYKTDKRWFRSVYTKVSDEEVLFTFDDITNEKEANLRMEYTQSILLQSQDLGKVGSFELNLENNELLWSDTLYRIYGYEPGEVEVDNYQFLDLIHPDDRGYVFDVFTSQIYQHEAVEYEFKFMRKDDTEGTGQGKIRSIINSEGKVCKVIGFVQDISDRVKILEQLKELNAKLEQRVEERTMELKLSNDNLKNLNESLDKYAYIISHDLKAPLASIDGLINFLNEDYQDKALDQEGLEMLEMITEKVGVMRTIIDEVLKRVKHEKLIKVPVNLSDVVREVINTLNPPEYFNFIIDQNLPTVKYNKASVIQIMQNLISNAIKFMDKNEPVVKITCIEERDFFKIVVIDNGQGIPKGKLDKIFEAFEVAHKAERIESHGLGLSIVKQLVESHGGNVWAESEFGQGTCFYFTIPKEG
ncbi:MAG: ATP-binding protein [Cytophagaceae bacterium]